MFCTSLRRRQSFSSAIPALISRDGLCLMGTSSFQPDQHFAEISPRATESQLSTHDIAIPLQPQPGNPKATKRHYRFLLLSPTSTTDLNTAITLSQIQHFASLTGGADIAIIMLLDPPPTSTTKTTAPLIKPFAPTTSLPPTSTTNGMHAYAKLQAELLVRSDIPNLSILPLHTLADLPTLLKSTTDAVNRRLPHTKTLPTKPLHAAELLEYCTTDPPLPSLAVNLATDIFPSLRALVLEATALKASKAGVEESEEQMRWMESGGTSVSLRDELQPGLAVMRGQVNDAVVDGMVEFWEDEWAVE